MIDQEVQQFKNITIMENGYRLIHIKKMVDKYWNGGTDITFRKIK